jgi:transposase-like protein
MGRKRYAAEFKREAVRQASQPGVSALPPEISSTLN